MSRWCAGAARNAIMSMIVIVATIIIWPAGALAEETGGSGGSSASPDSGPAVHYDTSAPLQSIPPSNTPGQVYPARPGPPLPSASSQTSAPDTSGTQLASPLSPLMPSTSANFNGIGENACNCVPPDPSGAAGPTQYVEVANTDVAVYSKTGTALLGPEATNTLWSGFGGGCEKNNNGDGTVLFDTINQRWVVQQFSVSTTPYLDCVAISSTSDATGTWHRYSFEYSKFPDYPKMGVWPDAYYASFNLFNLSPEKFEGTEACAFNRAKMLNGEAASQQCFVGSPTGGKSLLPATLDGTTQPPSGEAEWFVALSPTTANALAYWKFYVDWSNPANTTFTGPTNLPVEAFSQACEGGACIPQAETTNRLDSLGDRLMFRLAYRNFGGHEAMVVSHAVTAGSSVGMRWYELRPSGGSLTVYQQGTYAPDSAYRWMGSIAMDKAGDMALGDSVSSSSLHPQIRYTGRLVGDPLGTMPQGEATLYEGTGSQTSYARWGDYTEMSVDPSDDCTFWYANEYLPSNGSFNWHTRIGAFKYPSCSGAPSATTEPATSVTPSGATLNGTVNPEGSETHYYFEYDTKEYKQGEEPHGTKTAETSAGSGTSNVKESKAITGLTASTHYHFRIVASNSHGTTDGSDQAFTTLPEPPKNIEPPVASPATPDQAVPESTTNGTWTNNPTSYAYQWERCNGTGGECAVISGATSSTYTPVEADVGHTLVVKVTAKNSGGEGSAFSKATNKVEPIGKITEYALSAGTEPWAITAGPDGNLWFTYTEYEKVGKITTSGVVTEYSVPNGRRGGGITVGPDNNLWFTGLLSNNIVKLTTSGTATEYSLPAFSEPCGITVGPDGNLWFTIGHGAGGGTNRIGKITTSGTITEYAVPSGYEPFEITAGPDGNLWFTIGNGTSRIGKITTSGIVTEYVLPAGSEGPEGITSGPDGNLWFTDRNSNKIGKITTSGTVTEYSLPSGSGPSAIIKGPDGNLWFTDHETGKIGRITTAGAITEYALPEKSGPWQITVGPDDNIWFTDIWSNKVGKITP